MQEQLPRVKRGAAMDGGMQICREQKSVRGSPHKKNRSSFNVSRTPN